MAEYDDDDPGFDDAFRDEPDAKPPLKRFSRPRSGGEPDSGATGEVPRPSATGARRGRSSGGGRRPGRGSRSSRGSGGRGSGGAAILQNPKARLGLGVLFAAILILVITLVVRDCQRSQLEDSYTSYLNSVAQIVTSSADQGQQLRTVLSNAEGLRPPQLRAAIQSLGTEAQGLVDQAEGLDPPGALSRPNGSLVSLLQYRVTGLNQLAANLPTLLQNDDDDFKARGIAQQMQRFLASDVIYEDSFATPARAAMADDDITGVEVPKLQPFLSNVALAAPGGARSLLPGLQRTAPSGDGGDDSGDAGGNLRGTGLVKTEALPSETRLSPGSVTTVEASENLEWRVSVENGGDFAETDVVVKATFSYPDAPNDGEVREASIPTIQPGEVVSINIPGPTENIDYREQGNLVIEIAAVPQESNTDNNRAEYPVKIAL